MSLIQRWPMPTQWLRSVGAACRDVRGAWSAATIRVYRLGHNGRGGAPTRCYIAGAAAQANKIGQPWVTQARVANQVGMCSPR